MTDDQVREPRTFAINRGFLTRVSAIGLFVALGTFAVTQSLSKPKGSGEGPGGAAVESVAKASSGEAPAADGLVASQSTTEAPKSQPETLPVLQVKSFGKVVEPGKSNEIASMDRDLPAKSAESKASPNPPELSGGTQAPLSSNNPANEFSAPKASSFSNPPGSLKLPVTSRTESDNSFPSPNGASQAVITNPSAMGSDSPQMNKMSDQSANPEKGMAQLGTGSASPTVDTLPKSSASPTTLPLSKSFDASAPGNSPDNDGAKAQSSAGVESAKSDPSSFESLTFKEKPLPAPRAFDPSPSNALGQETSKSNSVAEPPSAALNADVSRLDSRSMNNAPVPANEPNQKVPGESLTDRSTAVPTKGPEMAAPGQPAAQMISPQNPAFGQNGVDPLKPGPLPSSGAPKPLNSADSSFNAQKFSEPSGTVPPNRNANVANDGPSDAASMSPGQPLNRQAKAANRLETQAAPKIGTLPNSIPADNRPMSLASANTRGTPGDARLEGRQTPSLAIEKIAPEEIQVHQIAKFKIAVRNIGKVTANEVVVSDQIPAGTEFISSAPAASQRTADGKIQWSLGHMDPGDEQFIEMELRPSQPGEIGSVAQVTFSSQASMRTRVTRPELVVEHSGPAKALIGSAVALKITVHNRGNGPASDVLLQEKVPSQLKYADEFRDLEYPIGTIPPGQSRDVTLNLTAIEAGRFQNVVVVTGAGNLQTQHALDMEIVAPQLQGAVQGPSRRFLKREAKHTYSLSNQGTANATNVDIVAKLPRGVQFVAANNRGQYDSGSHSVYWSLAELPPGQPVEVALTTLPIETGNHEIEFRTSADLQQSVSSRQALTIEHLVDVHFEIDDLEDHIEIGGNTRYRIRIVNQGTKPANNVLLTTELAAGLRPTAVDSSLQYELRGQQIVFAPISNINPGEELSLEIEAVGVSAGEHRVAANLRTDGREVNITKEESTRVYADR